MYRFIALGAIFAVGVHVHSQPAQTFRPSSLSLNQTSAQVLQQLGKPEQTETLSFDACNDSVSAVRWHYPGLSVTFTNNGHAQHVSQIDVTQGPWQLNGIGIGDNSSQIKRTFGDTQFIHDVMPYTQKNGQHWEFTMRHQQVAAMSLTQSCSV